MRYRVAHRRSATRSALTQVLDLMKKFIAILMLLTLSSVAYAQRVSSFGHAPDGYSWFSPKDGGAAVLKPDGWFTRFESKNGTDALFISKEDIAASGEFQTGLSLIFVHGVQAKTGMTSSKYAVSFLSKALEGNEELMAFGTPGKGMTTIGLRLKNKKLDKVIHYYLVANDVGDTLHIFMFESPAQDWDSAWTLGEPMFRNLRLLFRK